MNEPTPPTTKLLLTVEEAAEELSCGRTQVFHLIASGALRTVKIGRLRRVPAAALEDLITRLAEDEAATSPVPLPPLPAVAYRPPARRRRDDPAEVHVTLPPETAEALADAAADLDVARDELVRAALRDYLRKLRREQMTLGGARVSN